MAVSGFIAYKEGDFMDGKFNPLISNKLTTQQPSEQEIENLKLLSLEIMIFRQEGVRRQHIRTAC